MNTSAIASDAQGAGHPAPAGIDAPWTAPTVTRRQVSYATWVCFSPGSLPSTTSSSSAPCCRNWASTSSGAPSSRRA